MKSKINNLVVYSNILLQVVLLIHFQRSTLVWFNDGLNFQKKFLRIVNVDITECFRSILTQIKFLLR